MVPAIFSIYSGQSAGDQFFTREAVEDFETIIVNHTTVLDFHAILGPSVAKVLATTLWTYFYFHKRSSKWSQYPPPQPPPFFGMVRMER